MRYLVSYNGSEISKAALTLARDYAEKFDAKVYVVTSMAGGAAEKPKQIDRATRDLAYAEKFLQEKSVRCETHQLARGMAPGEDMVRFASENDIALIFVGIEKKSRTQKIILGSNAQYIILKSPCPVVSVNRSD